MKSITQLIKKFHLKINMIKVKAHDGVKDNEKADILVKQELNDTPISTKNTGYDLSYCLSWYSIRVKENNRKFIKKINGIKRDLNENNLKRISRKKNIDKD